MSGGGRIIEKCRVTLTDEDDPQYRKEVVRYWLVTGESYDELWVYAEPAEDEPQLGKTIWWGSGSAIYWGENDQKRLVKVGYSIAPDRAALRQQETSR